MVSSKRFFLFGYILYNNFWEECIADIAQSVERQTEDLKALGSNPSVRSRFCSHL